MLAAVQSASVVGVDAHPVLVEVDVARGLPAWSIVGLASNAVKCSLSGVQAALGARCVARVETAERAHDRKLGAADSNGPRDGTRRRSIDSRLLRRFRVPSLSSFRETTRRVPWSSSSRPSDCVSTPSHTLPSLCVPDRTGGGVRGSAGSVRAYVRCALRRSGFARSCSVSRTGATSRSGRSSAI